MATILWKRVSSVRIIIEAEKSRRRFESNDSEDEVPTWTKDNGQLNRIDSEDNENVESNVWNELRCA
ncbi:hypothetical protein KIN20_003462 [Parelaphostrongylus tenuis]|uniref:Uncharacterized protein n=1 Tax=Parelaphostrongylus tenuis TaxID=148309 RepID=A0AAD5MPY9_PARTN|nr:hypothetical protein KIN20_003462 [Parelaphostrongylus tenuis]